MGAFLLVLCLGLAGSAEAAHYYVTQSGAGTRDGLSWVNALDEAGFRAKLEAASNGDIFWVARGSTAQPCRPTRPRPTRASRSRTA